MATAFGASNLVLTNVGQIRNLTTAEAGKSLPVQLRGVVVDESQPANAPPPQLENLVSTHPNG